MKFLIIGAAGFVGGHLIDAIAQNSDNVIFATKLPVEQVADPRCKVVDLDICDADAVLRVMRETKPDRIVHLAAQSSVAVSWKNPRLTANVNIMGTVNILEAMRGAAPEARLLSVGSGEEYGAVTPAQCPVTEDTPLRPVNYYAVTKVCTEQTALHYAKAFGLHIVVTRSFNHFGPRQSDIFVMADFCKQAAAISLGLREPVIRTGNLSAKRDFTDVRDIVRAYLLLLEKGTAGEVYNVGSGHAQVISDLLVRIRQLSGAEFSVVTDPARFRPVDVPLIEANIEKLQRDTGWAPEYHTDQTIADTLRYWRAQLTGEQNACKS